jgi:hypothetical protein
MIRTLGAYLLCVLSAYVLATLFATQSVISRLQEMGITLSFTEKWNMSLQDLAGLTGIFLPVIALGFLIALVVATLIGRRKPAWLVFLFPLAGAVAVVAVHISLKAMFGITVVAVARSIPGLLTQAAAGAIGGYAFAFLIRRRV